MNLRSTDRHEDLSESSVLESRTDGILTLTLNRPHLKNAMDRMGWDRLFDLLRSAAVDDNVRAVVLQGAGGNFCSGADISGATVGHPLTRIRRIGEVAQVLFEMPKPVIAKVEGVAVGAGWNMALCCDFVIASSTARFSQIFAKRGLSIDFGGSWLLPRLTSPLTAKRLALFGEFIDASEARDLGLVTWVQPPESIDGFVTEVARSLASGPPVALAQTKELLNAALATSFGTAVASETRAQAVNYATEDALLARAAFNDKTGANPPSYTGAWVVP